MIPGIIAWQMYAEERPDLGDKAYPVMIAEILPAWLRGILLAALAGRCHEHLQLGTECSLHHLHHRRPQAMVPTQEFLQEAKFV